MDYTKLQPGLRIRAKYGNSVREVLHVGIRSLTVRAFGDDGSHHDYEIPRHVIETLWDIEGEPGGLIVRFDRED